MDREHSPAKKDKKKKHKHSDEEKKHKHKKHHERSRSRSPHQKKDKDKKKHRSRSKDDRKHKHRDRSSDRRDRDRHREHRDHRDYRDRDDRRKDRQKDDKYDRWRRQKERDRFRYDSPPKSGSESNVSQDSEKMYQLNKMKAEKELVSSKADRKLYLGNLPPNITSNQLLNMLNSALKKMEINTDGGDSITSAWISPDGVGHYAFIEFRSAQDATAGLALNGASLFGYQLKLGRPKQYIEYHKQLLSEFGSDQHIDTILRKVQALGGYEDADLVFEERLFYPPSKVVVLKHIVTIEELGIDQEYEEILEDVREMAGRHGDVLKIVIPRPLEIDLEEVKRRVKGLGFIFIKYKSVEQARYARKEFIKTMFSERSVACGFFPEDQFERGELDVMEKIVIDF